MLGPHNELHCMVPFAVAILDCSAPYFRNSKEDAVWSGDCIRFLFTLTMPSQFQGLKFQVHQICEARFLVHLSTAMKSNRHPKYVQVSNQTLPSPKRKWHDHETSYGFKMNPTMYQYQKFH